MSILIIVGIVVLLALACGKSSKQHYLESLDDTSLDMNDYGARMDGEYPNMYSVERERRSSRNN